MFSVLLQFSLELAFSMQGLTHPTWRVTGPVWSLEAWRMFSKDSLQRRCLGVNDFTFPWKTISVQVLWVSLKLKDTNWKPSVQVPMIYFSWEQAFLKWQRIQLMQHVCSQLRMFPFNERNTWCSCCHRNKTCLHRSWAREGYVWVGLQVLGEVLELHDLSSLLWSSFWVYSSSFWIYSVRGWFVYKCYSWLHGAIEEYKITHNQISDLKISAFCSVEIYQQSSTVLPGTKSFNTNVSTPRLTARSADVFLGAKVRDQLLKNSPCQAMRYFEKVEFIAWVKAAQQGGC